MSLNFLNLSADMEVCYFFIMPFALIELKNIIYSCSSATSQFDEVSPFMLKNIPLTRLNTLLCILNRIWHCSVVPDSWKKFPVISIPKVGSFAWALLPYRNINIFCKIVELIPKNWLGFILESKFLLLINLFDIRRRLDIMEYLTSLVGQI